MPAGKIRAGDVADFAAFDERVERLQSLFDGSERVEGMHVVDVDVVDREAAETVFAGLDEVLARRAEIVGAVAHGESGFRGDKNAVAFAGDSFAEDLFGEAAGVNVGGVEEIDAGFEANVDEARGFGDVAGAPGFEKFVAAAEGAGAETENGNLQAGMAELSEFHNIGLDVLLDAVDTCEAVRYRSQSARRMTRVMSSLCGAPEAKASAACMILEMESLAGRPAQLAMAWISRSSPHSSRLGFMASLKPSV